MFGIGKDNASSERKTGTTGVNLRKKRRKAHPLCADCLKRGLVEKTTQIDHIKPLMSGGTDTDDNVQGLCDDCHARKTRRERTGNPCIGYDDTGRPLEPTHPWNSGQ